MVQTRKQKRQAMESKKEKRCIMNMTFAKNVVLLISVASTQIAFCRTPSVVSVVESRTGDPVPMNLISAMNAGNIERFNAILKESDFDINEIIVVGNDFRSQMAASPTGDPMDAPFLPASFFAPEGEKMDLSAFRLSMDYHPNRIVRGGDHSMMGFYPYPDPCPAKPSLVKKFIGYKYVSQALGVEWKYVSSISSTVYGTLLMVAARTGNAFMVKELLTRGADPNIMIKTGGVETKMGIRECERQYICALIEAATEGMFYSANPTSSQIMREGHKKSSRSIAECINLLVAAGAALPPPDGMGRNALWDALACQNETLLELALKSGLNINTQDNKGKTVLDYCARAAGDTSRARGERVSYERFAAFLRKAGGTCSEESEEENEDSKNERGASAQQPGGGGEMYAPNAPVQQSGNSYSPMGGGMGVNPYLGTGVAGSGFGPGIRQKKDNTAEIKILELRLVGLRRQLEDAEHDSRMSGLQGIGTVTTSMRVQSIMRQIQEVQGRLLQLQD